MDPTKKRLHDDTQLPTTDYYQQPALKKARVNSETCILPNEIGILPNEIGIFPNEIWGNVVTNLNLSDLAKIKRVSTILYAIANERWDESCKNECQKIYPLKNYLYESIKVNNWSEFFKSLITLKKEVEKVDALSPIDMGIDFPASRYYVLKNQFSGKGQELCILSNYLQFFDIAFPPKKDGEIVGSWVPDIGKKWSQDLPKIKFGLKCLRLAHIQQNFEAMSALTRYEALKRDNMGCGIPLWENESNPFGSLF